MNIALMFIIKAKSSDINNVDSYLSVKKQSVVDYVTTQHDEMNIYSDEKAIEQTDSL